MDRVAKASKVVWASVGEYCLHEQTVKLATLERLSRTCCAKFAAVVAACCCSRCSRCWCCWSAQREQLLFYDAKKERVKFISGVQNQISAHFHSFTKFLTFQSLLMFETILISCSTIYTNHFTCLYNNVALPLFVKSHFQCSIFFVHICCS